MNLNEKCCDALGCRNEIQTELNRLNKLLADIMAIAGVTSQDDILAAVRGIVSPEWVSADLVPPTEPGWYWISLPDRETCFIGTLNKWPECDAQWLFNSCYEQVLTGTRYIKINQPAGN